MKAIGTFEISVRTTTPPVVDAEGVVISGITFDKQFVGELVGSSVVHFLAARTPKPESAGYVALEHIEGQLAGRSGAFVLQHSGVMAAGSQQLHVQVVPDSATGELKGLTGQMKIVNASGQHSYEFDYDFPDSGVS